MNINIIYNTFISCTCFILLIFSFKCYNVKNDIQKSLDRIHLHLWELELEIKVIGKMAVKHELEVRLTDEIIRQNEKICKLEESLNECFKIMFNSYNNEKK